MLEYSNLSHVMRYIHIYIYIYTRDLCLYVIYTSLSRTVFNVCRDECIIPCIDEPIITYDSYTLLSHLNLIVPVQPFDCYVHSTLIIPSRRNGSRKYYWNPHADSVASRCQLDPR